MNEFKEFRPYLVCCPAEHGTKYYPAESLDYAEKTAASHLAKGEDEEVVAIYELKEIGRRHTEILWSEKYV